jgi:predicted DNA-binding ribbon-helix-helix protein
LQEEVTGTLIKRSFSLVGRRTSVALEQEFWAALTHIAASRRQALTSLMAEADARRRTGQPLASALRVFALQAFSMPASPNCATKRLLGSDGRPGTWRSAVG